MYRCCCSTAVQLQEYKSAASFLLNHGSSKAEREALRATLASLSSQVVAGIAAGRGLTEKQVPWWEGRRRGWRARVGSSCMRGVAGARCAEPDVTANSPAPSHALCRLSLPLTARRTWQYRQRGWGWLTPACIATRHSRHVAADGWGRRSVLPATEKRKFARSPALFISGHRDSPPPPPGPPPPPTPTPTHPPTPPIQLVPRLVEARRAGPPPSAANSSSGQPAGLLPRLLADPDAEPERKVCLRKVCACAHACVGCVLSALRLRRRCQLAWSRREELSECTLLAQPSPALAPPRPVSPPQVKRISVARYAAALDQQRQQREAEERWEAIKARVRAVAGRVLDVAGWPQLWAALRRGDDVAQGGKAADQQSSEAAGGGPAGSAAAAPQPMPRVALLTLEGPIFLGLAPSGPSPSPNPGAKVASLPVIRVRERGQGDSAQQYFVVLVPGVPLCALCVPEQLRRPPPRLPAPPAQALQKAREDKAVKAVVLRVDSPGGWVGGWVGW